MLDVKAIADAGGWVVAIFVLLLVLEGFRRGWIVPGFIYKREVDRGDRADNALSASTKATQESTRASRDLARQFESLQRRLGGDPDEPA